MFSMRVRPRTVLKSWVPGYQRRWVKRCSVLLSAIDELYRTAEFSQNADAVQVMLSDGTCIHGFASDQAHHELAFVLRSALPRGFDSLYFRLARDLVTRFQFPHLRPDVRPRGTLSQLFGFHGQHRDAIADLEDEAARDELVRIFQPKVDEIILEGGAFIGLGALAVSNAVAPGRVIAVEADPECFALLEKNLRSNSTAPVSAVHAALWNRNETMSFSSGYAQGNSLLSQFVDDENRTQVAARRLDDLVRDMQLERLDMVSLTINGAEPEALEGARDVMASFRPRFRIAGWYQRDGSRIADLVRGPLEAADYRVWIGPRGNCLAVPVEALAAK
jgi:FkbM family methyltransferase